MQRISDCYGLPRISNPHVVDDEPVTDAEEQLYLILNNLIQLTKISSIKSNNQSQNDNKTVKLNPKT